MDDRLLFTGHVTDQDAICELYHNAYGYFHGHEYGGTNPTMIQALAYGTAILALDTVFNQEMLQNGKFGLYFAKESEKVTELVNEVDDDPERMSVLRENSRNGLGQRYDWEHVADQYLQVFEQLADRK